MSLTTTQLKGTYQQQHGGEAATEAGSSSGQGHSTTLRAAGLLSCLLTSRCMCMGGGCE